MAATTKPEPMTLKQLATTPTPKPARDMAHGRVHPGKNLGHHLKPRKKR